MDCSPLGSSAHGIHRARILEWIAIPFSIEYFWPRGRTQVSCTTGKFFPVQATREDGHNLDMQRLIYCRWRMPHKIGDKRKGNLLYIRVIHLQLVKFQHLFILSPGIKLPGSFYSPHIPLHSILITWNHMLHLFSVIYHQNKRQKF